MPEEDRATDISNMHKEFGKDRACGSRDILTDRQRDRHTDRHTSQYFATTPTGKVKNLLKSVLTFDNLGVFLKGTETSGYATWFTAGGAIHIAHYDVITRKL